VASTLTGFVYDPANNLPVYNALVYAPVGTVQTRRPASTGELRMRRPPAYASTYTGIDGSFTLPRVPSGANVTIVVQLGKWQRASPSRSPPLHVSNTLASHLTLPSTRAEGNIPRFAVDTGGVDAMECVLLKMGIASDRVHGPRHDGSGVPTAAGRVHLYEGHAETGIGGTTDPTGGQIIDNNTPAEDAISSRLASVERVRRHPLPLQGRRGALQRRERLSERPRQPARRTGTSGGRFTTHYSYVWLFQNGAYENTATWEVNNAAYTQEFTGFIDTSFATGATLSTWLKEAPVNASTNRRADPGQRRAQRHLRGQRAGAQLLDVLGHHGPGRARSEGSGGVPAPLHVRHAGRRDGVRARRLQRLPRREMPRTILLHRRDVPERVQRRRLPGSMTPQEKLLEFMLFDLTSCVSPPVCTPLTCASFPRGTCGPQGNGCGGLTVDCGDCTPPQTCGGGGVPGQCGAPDAGACQPQTCAQQNVFCGNTGDGCGNVIQCGMCTPPQTCGGGGVPGQCGAPDGHGAAQAEVVRRAGDPVRSRQRRLREHPHVPGLPDRAVLQHDDGSVRAELAVAVHPPPSKVGSEA
jgi:hypothetical protein